MPVHDEAGGHFQILVLRAGQWKHLVWCEDQAEVDSWLTFLKETPVDDGPIKLRVREYGVVKDREVA